MKNKYYKPEIEEFHVGFEYEVFEKGQLYDPNIMTFMPIETKDKYYKFTYPDPFYGYKLDRLFNQKDLRVKWLDQEDLESLGWKYNGSGWYDLINVPGSLGYFTHVKFKFWGKQTSIIAYRGEPSIATEEQHLFVGEIKNKSELKRIMKQIQIL